MCNPYFIMYDEYIKTNKCTIKYIPTAPKEIAPKKSKKSKKNVDAAAVKDTKTN